MPQKKTDSKTIKSTRAKRSSKSKKKIVKKVEEKNKPEISSEEQSQRIENDKRLIMWSGVVFFMVLIVFLWIINLDKIFQTDKFKNENQEFNWGEMSNDLSEKLGDFKNDLGEIKDSGEELLKDSEENVATSTEENIENSGFPPSISQEERLELIKVIEELEKDFEKNN